MGTLPEFVGKRLAPLTTDLPPSWQLWQYKSFNLHRGVISWDATSTGCTLPEIREQVRAVVRDRFRPSWWRGFGFGVVVSLGQADDSLRNAVDLVDVRNNGKGTWQWLVLHFPASRAAAGICTWTEGYLAPVYRDLLAALGSAGFDCESYRKDMDAFMKGLLAIQKKPSLAHRVLGGLDCFLE